MKERKSGPIIVAVVAIPLLLFGAYMGSYYAMLEAAIPARPPSGVIYTYPLYRWDSLAMENVLSPANQLDRLIRPSYWEPPPPNPAPQI